MLQVEYDLRVRCQESFLLAQDEQILCMLSFFACSLSKLDWQYTNIFDK